MSLSSLVIGELHMVLPDWFLRYRCMRWQTDSINVWMRTEMVQRYHAGKKQQTMQWLKGECSFLETVRIGDPSSQSFLFLWAPVPLSKLVCSSPSKTACNDLWWCRWKYSTMFEFWQIAYISTAESDNSCFFCYPSWFQNPSAKHSDFIFPTELLVKVFLPNTPAVSLNKVLWGYVDSWGLEMLT